MAVDTGDLGRPHLGCWSAGMGEQVALSAQGWARHLRFRDRLRRDAGDRRRYEDLKRSLAER